MEYIKEIILEETTNTHKLKGRVLGVKKVLKALVLKTGGKSKVYHGEHKTISINSPDVIKINQQEFNPVTKKIQDAAD